MVTFTSIFLPVMTNRKRIKKGKYCIGYHKSNIKRINKFQSMVNKNKLKFGL